MSRCQCVFAIECVGNLTTAGEVEAIRGNGFQQALILVGSVGVDAPGLMAQALPATGQPDLNGLCAQCTSQYVA